MQNGRVVTLHPLKRRGRRECDVGLGRDVSCRVSTHSNIRQGCHDKGTRGVARWNAVHCGEGIASPATDRFCAIPSLEGRRRSRRRARRCRWDCPQGTGAGLVDAAEANLQPSASQWLADHAWKEEDSGKCERLREIAEVIASRQEKMLVFTQFRAVIDPLAALLAGLFGRPGLTLHGETEVRKRKLLVRISRRTSGSRSSFCRSRRRRKTSSSRLPGHGRGKDQRADRVERRPFEGIAGRIRRSQPDGTRQRRDPAAGLPRSPHGDEGLTYMGFGDPPPYQTSRFRSQGGGQDASRQCKRHRRRRPSAPRRRGKGSFRARPSRKAFARHANKRRPDANPGVLAGRAAGS